MAVISLFGDSLGSKIIVPLLLNTFTAGTSWQAGYTALAVAVVLCGGVAVCLTKERGDPKDEAELATAKHALAQLSPPPSQEQQEQRLSSDDDEEPPDETETGPLVAPSAAAGTTWTRAQVLHSPTFWVYALALASSYMLEMGWLYEVREVVTAMTTSTHAFADSSDSGDRGESTAGTTAGVSLVIFIRGVCSCGGTALGGMLYDRHGARTCVVLAQLCQVVSMALMGWPRPSLGSRIWGQNPFSAPGKDWARTFY